MVAGGAAALYRVTGDNVSLVQAAGGEHGLGTIVAALRARGPVSAVNYPAGGEVARALRAAGADVSAAPVRDGQGPRLVGSRV